jgi:hypothetical protein
LVSLFPKLISRRALRPSCPQRILILAENNVAANSKSQGFDRPRRLGCSCVGMDPCVAEGMTEAALHEGACGSVYRLAARAQRFVDNRWGLSAVLH